MNIERFSEDFNISSSFPDAKLVGLGEGSSVYTALHNGNPVLIIDSRTLLDMFSGDEREDLSDSIVAVYTFETELERSEYLKRKSITPVIPK